MGKRRLSVLIAIWVVVGKDLGVELCGNIYNFIDDKTVIVHK